MFWAIFKPKGILRSLYLPLWVLKVVRGEDAVSRCTLQNPSLVSNLEKTVAPANLCEISSNVGAL